MVVTNNKVSKQRNDDYNNWWNANLNNNPQAVYDSKKWVAKKRTNAIIGMGICTVGFVFISAAAVHYIDSITIYNAKHKSTGYIPVQYDLMVSADGVGVSMRF